MSRGTLSTATLFKVILYGISAQSDCSLSSRSCLADVHKFNDPRRKATAFTGPLHSNSILSLHPGNVTCLKITHPKYIQHNPHPIFFAKDTILIKSTQTVQCKRPKCKHKTEDNRAERSDDGGVVGFKSHCMGLAKRGHRSETEMCATYVLTSVDRHCAIKKNTPCVRVHCLDLILCPDSLGHLVLT